MEGPTRQRGVDGRNGGGAKRMFWPTEVRRERGKESFRTPVGVFCGT